MCGICGFISLQPNVRLKEIFLRMLAETQDRGHDATGISWFDNLGQIQYVKAPLEAKGFLKEDIIKAALMFDDSNIVIGHCRAGTHGSEYDNLNNHPVIVEDNAGEPIISLIHNGIITSKPTDSIKRRAEVDSEYIALAIYDLMQKRSSAKKMRRIIAESVFDLYGGQACAALFKDKKDSLFLWRSGNPIELIYVEELQTIFFASTYSILKEGLKDVIRYDKVFGLFLRSTPRCLNYMMPEDEVFEINITDNQFGIRTTKAVKKPYTYTYPYEQRDSWWNKNKKQQEMWNGEKVYDGHCID